MRWFGWDIPFQSLPDECSSLQDPKITKHGVSGCLLKNIVSSVPDANCLTLRLVHELTALRTLVGPAFIASLVIPSMTRSSWRAGQGVRGCNIMNTTSRTPPMSQRSSRMHLLLFIRTMFLIVTVLLLFLFEYFSSLPSFLVVYEMVITGWNLIISL
ncbi:hypothetical protein BDBG_09056 [Blastomyces gilchristii SLH14081]|uniref:Uncharacterized protein n=1 Tax=Blastomyces gilchristii (strain SLH14081) TaxID=559298 RepID=A0A179V3E2_BLAGS|nr:uncharacterized protein BDBG_09056 [Blastomyces gilchristii SLH14081]OAT13948.1 hypothetical protein BDBG_09056 [Blastomyces gilchristii SLH14081]